MLLAAAIALGSIQIARADHHPDHEDRAKWYHGNEFSVDLFGTYATRDRRGANGDRLGGGVGVNYFITPHLGIGADTYIEEWKVPYRANGSVILRLPIPKIGLAPYAIAGGGRQFKDVPQYTAHVGGGAEFRFTEHSGIFGDIRRVFTDRTPDYTLIRAGLRIPF